MAEIPAVSEPIPAVVVPAPAAEVPVVAEVPVAAEVPAVAERVPVPAEIPAVAVAEPVPAQIEDPLVNAKLPAVAVVTEVPATTVAPVVAKKCNAAPEKKCGCHKNKKASSSLSAMYSSLTDILTAVAQGTPVCLKNVSLCVDTTPAKFVALYKENPFQSAVIICLVLSIVCYTLGVVTGDLSWVDRLWSVLPVAYTIHFFSYNTSDPRLQAMVALTTAWGFRLSYNFFRKG